MSVVLSEHLPLLASAPDGIQKLRGLILELAVSGKLVPQDPSDEPASELLKRIAKERSRLEAEGKIKKSKQPQPVKEDEQPFKLPPSWAWVRLPEVYFSISPSSNKLLSSAIQETGAVPVVDQGKRYIAGYTDHVSMLIRIPGPVVIFGDHTTERKYVDFDFVAGADGVKILRPILQFEKFFFRQLQSFKLEERGYARHFKVLNDQFYALPPLLEQHRIVAKIDELMALCDRLEQEVGAGETAHAKLVETLLGTLTQSTDDSDLAANWQRLAEHFDTLFATEARIDALKQTILQLAVMGKLVPQDPSDEPATELLKWIAKERVKLEAEGKIKKSKTMSPVGEDEYPFSVPDSWTWERLGAVSVTSTGKTPATSKAEYYGAALPFIGPGQLTPSGEILPPEKMLSDAGRDETTLATEGDILMVCIGGSIGKAAIANMVIAFNQQINCASPILVSSRYVYSGMTAQHFQKAVLAKATGSATPIINRSNWDEIPLPIPPLAEQHRIVTKVDELMALCDNLKADLAESRIRQTRLSATLIESALQAS